MSESYRFKIVNPHLPETSSLSWSKTTPCYGIYYIWGNNRDDDNLFSLLDDICHVGYHLYGELVFPEFQEYVIRATGLNIFDEYSLKLGQLWIFRLTNVNIKDSLIEILQNLKSKNEVYFKDTTDQLPKGLDLTTFKKFRFCLYIPDAKPNLNLQHLLELLIDQFDKNPESFGHIRVGYVDCELEDSLRVTIIKELGVRTDEILQEYNNICLETEGKNLQIGPITVSESSKHLLPCEDKPPSYEI